MECIGQLKNVTKNWMSNKFELTFEVEGDVTGQIDVMKDKVLNITAKQFRKKRSLDANAYYWSLLSKLSKALNISKNHAHNIMLRRYGQLEEIDGQMLYVVVPDSEDGLEMALEAETYHIKPTSETRAGKDGTAFRTYYMLRGSSTYNTDEMSRLIDGLVSECRELGIETMTPDHITEMMMSYEQNWRKKHEEAI